jgi:hypothetical protein
MANDIKNIDPNDPKLSIGSFNEIANQARELQGTLISGSHFSSLGILTRLIRSVGIDIRIFKVHENATGDAIYNCYEQLVVDADWDDINGAVKIWDKDEEPEAVEVLNLNEHNPNAGQHRLVEGDILVAYHKIDDKGTMRWFGISVEDELHKAYCKTAAPADSKITCYLDIDETGNEIEVNCQIFAASVLSECYPFLNQHDPIDVYYVDGGWWCDWWFNGYIECEPPE